MSFNKNNQTPAQKNAIFYADHLTRVAIPHLFFMSWYLLNRATEGAHRFSGNVVSFHKWQHRADIVGVNIDFLTYRFTCLKVFKIGGSRFLLLFLVNIIVKKLIFMQTIYLVMLCHARPVEDGLPCVSSKELLMSVW